MIADAAKRLFDAERSGKSLKPITDTQPGLSVEAAYELQAAVLALRLEAGEHVVGAKLGLTSRAKQQTMGVQSPIFAPLTDAMAWPAHSPLPIELLIHPRVEPEIVFLMGESLTGPGVTALDVLGASAGVAGGLEVIDSRYENFRFTHPDVVADLASAARFVLGPVLVGPTFDLSLVGCSLELDGNVVHTAAGAAILGHPANAVALLVNHLAERGERLEQGSVVLAGAMTDAIPLPPGSEIRATFGRLGTVGLRGV
jgi:2-oxo-3-hexenedioate decarboxylase